MPPLPAIFWCSLCARTTRATLIEVDFSPELLALNFGLVVLEAALCIKEVPGSYVWNGIIVLIIAVVNLRGLVETCLRFLHRR